MLAALYGRELRGYVHTPIAYAVGALFLAVQGSLFWALVELLADPTRPAPFGAVMSSFFGGQVLYWLVTFLVVVVAAGPTITEERQSGTWETLMTAPVSDLAVVTAKWAAAATAAILVWLPTLAYPAIIAAFAPAGAELDTGAVASAYLGLAVQLAAFTAIGVVASASTRSFAAAGGITMLALIGLLLVGQLGEVGGWEPGSAAALIIEHVDVRAHLEAAARGELDSAALVFYVSVVVVALSFAHALVARGRLRRDAQLGRLVAGVLIAVIAVSVNVLAARHPRAVDLSRAEANQLSPATLAVLERQRQPVELMVVRPRFQRFEPIYAEISRILERMQRRQPLLSVSSVDPQRSPELAAEAAGDFGLDPEQLVEGGMLLARSGPRRAVIELLDLAELAPDDLGVGGVSQLRAEGSIAAAISRVTSRETPTVCFTDASGELPGTEPSHFADIERRLERDGLALTTIGDAGAGVPAECRVVAVLAPRMPLGPGAGRALAEYVQGGGRLYVALRERGASGAELALAEVGLGASTDTVSGEAGSLGLPGAWATSRGHRPDHPITARFHDRRTTVWVRPRAVVVDDPRATGLVESEPAADDPRGPWVAGAAEDPESGARAVLWGGGLGLALDARAANLELLVASLSWLAGRDTVIGEGQASPQAVRLLMSEDDRRMVFILCVIALPLAYLGIGGLLWWRRRRA